MKIKSDYYVVLSKDRVNIVKGTTKTKHISFFDDTKNKSKVLMYSSKKVAEKLINKNSHVFCEWELNKINAIRKSKGLVEVTPDDFEVTKLIMYVDIDLNDELKLYNPNNE